MYYTLAIKTWVGELGDKVVYSTVHEGDPKDPRLAVIGIHGKTATYTLRKGTALSRRLEIAKAVIIGNAPNTNNKLEELTEEEPQTFRNGWQLFS